MDISLIKWNVHKLFLLGANSELTQAESGC